MELFRLGVVVGLYILTILACALRVPRSHCSLFELKRRAEHNARYQHAYTRALRARPVDAVLTAIRGLVVVAAVATTLHLYGWVQGTVITCVAAVLLPGFCKQTVVTWLARWLYRLSEPLLVMVANWAPQWWLWLAGPGEPQLKINSTEELVHLVRRAARLRPITQQQVAASVQFATEPVGTIMTPMAKVHTVAASDTLGPVRLDELHKTGHSSFPVVGKDEQIVGILSITQLLDLTDKSSRRASRAMDRRVYYVHQDQPCCQALAVLATGHARLLVVLGSSGQAVGIVALSDVVDALGQPTTLPGSAPAPEDKTAVASYQA